MKKQELEIETRGRKPAKHDIPSLEIKDQRICLVNGVFGETGAGKSHQTINEVKFYNKTIPGQKNGRKVLIFDTNGEYTQFPEISLHHIRDFTRPMTLRINAKGRSINWKQDAAKYCAYNFKNGLLILDDIDKFCPFTKDEELIGLMMGGRHEGDDLVLCHQSLDMGTAIFYRNVFAIRLHNQVSNDETLKRKAQRHFDILRIAEKIVNKQYLMGNIRFFVTIDLRRRKIHGCTSEKAFISACREFLIENQRIVRQTIQNLISYDKIPYSQRNADSTFTRGLNQAIQDKMSMFTTEPFHD